jgi:transcriptional regulator with XRE-family HTH domain
VFLNSFCFMPKQYIDEESLSQIRATLWATSQRSGITLEDIQDRTGFSYSQVYRIVRGKNNVSVSHIIAVCRALEIQLSVVFNFEIKIPKYLPLRKELKAKN